MSNTANVHQQLDKALEAVDEYLNAGGQGRAERAIVRALDNVVEAVRELAGPVKKAAEPKADKPAAKKAPAKKAAAKK